MKELREAGLARPSLWIGCIVIPGVMLAGFLAWYGRAYPGIPLGVPVRTLVVGLLAVPALLVVQIFVLVLAPTRIWVTKKMIDISHGQSTLRIKAADMIEVAIEFDEQERPMLRLRYRMRGLRRSKPSRERMRVHAIGSKVDLVELEDLLGALMARRASGESAEETSPEEPQMTPMGPDESEHLGPSG